MIVALCAVLAIVAVVLAVMLVRTRRAVQAATALEEERSEQLTSVQQALREAEVAAEARGRERDESAAREQRLKRDAAEVARRLEALDVQHRELAARSEADATELDELRAERDALRAERDELRVERDELRSECDEAASQRDRLRAEHEALRRRSSVDDVDGPPSATLDGELAWAFTLARLDRLWRVSVASGTAAVSPLLQSESLLEDALEVVVAAAREEAGATVHLDYAGPGDVDGATAATVVGLFEELVASAVDVAEETWMSVQVGDSAVHVSVSAEADGEAVPVPGPASLLEDGGYRIDRVRG